MRREEDEQLWDLLGRPPPPDVSPFFARNVLRRIRQQPRWNLRPWLNWRRLVPASGLAAVLGVALFFAYSYSPPRESPTAEDDLVARIDAQDYEVVADLDELLAADENNLWDDNSSL